MKVNCPYTAIDLQIALLRVGKKFEALEKEHGIEWIENQMTNAMPGLPGCKTRAEYNQIVADHHGITVEGLVNSPNYEKLQVEYQESVVRKGIRFLEETFGFDNKEAWAIVAHDEIEKSL